jgi:hypothetical protein
MNWRLFPIFAAHGRWIGAIERSAIYTMDREGKRKVSYFYNQTFGKFVYSK